MIDLLKVAWTFQENFRDYKKKFSLYIHFSNSHGFVKVARKYAASGRAWWGVDWAVL